MGNVKRDVNSMHHSITGPSIDTLHVAALLRLDRQRAQSFARIPFSSAIAIEARCTSSGPSASRSVLACTAGCRTSLPT